MLLVSDIDSAFQRAVEAGAEAVMPARGYVLGRPLRPVARPVRRALGDKSAEGAAAKLKPFLTDCELWLRDAKLWTLFSLRHPG